MYYLVGNDKTLFSDQGLCQLQMTGRESDIKAYHTPPRTKMSGDLLSQKGVVSTGFEVTISNAGFDRFHENMI